MRPRHEPGERVFAVRDADESGIRAFGPGTYVGDHLRDGWREDSLLRALAVSVAQTRPTNEPLEQRVDRQMRKAYTGPLIVLDRGGAVWGIECWWGEEAGFERFTAGRQVEIVAPPRRDVPSVWSGEVPPGGYVCAACGWPTETMPCEDHQPEAWKAASS